TLEVTDEVPSLIVGSDGSKGTINHTAGDVIFADGASYGVYAVGYGVDGVGVANHSGGTVSMGGSAFEVGAYEGQGVYNLTDTAGVDLGSGSTIYIGNGSAGDGLLNIKDSAQFHQGTLATPGMQIFLGSVG